MELFVKICLKIKKEDIFESLLKLFVKKDVAYHFPRRTIHQYNNTYHQLGVSYRGSQVFFGYYEK